MAMARIKTGLMVLGLAGVLGAGTACFGLFTRDDTRARETTATDDDCAGLSGQARIDCENAKAKGR
jgi:hypothetical protein